LSREKKYPNNLNWHNLKKFIIVSRSQLRAQAGWFTIKHSLLIFLWLIPALFFVILFRLLKPWVIIRVRPLFHNRIGHFAANTEIYLCEKDWGIYGPKNKLKDIWYYNGYICNLQLKRMWDRVLKIWPTELSFLLTIINSRLPDGELFIIQMPNSDRDIHNVLELTPPHLSFTEDEEEFGRKKLESIGILPGSLFICFVGRDPNYTQLIYSFSGANHNDYRNTDVKNYLLAAEELVNRGYYAIRMGSVVAESLVSNNPKIIDYATNGQRSDFMDIYLGAKCHFFISVGSGIDAIPAIFRRPILYVNFVPLDHALSWGKNNLFIFKKHWLDKEQRFMSFREIIESGVGRFYLNHEYIDKGITLIENTPEEIREVTIEMEERLKGTWVTTDEDEDLQRKFWSLYKSSDLHGKIYSRIGAAFLIKYQALLE